MIDITRGYCGLLESITGWEVFGEHSLSDHRHILFTLRGSFPALLISKPMGSNWGSFREDLRDRLERGPEMSMEDEVGLGLAVHWIQEGLITALKIIVLLDLIRKGKLESLRREDRRLITRCRANNKSSSWELYKEAQRRYRKEVRKASKETWRTSCGSVKNLPISARLHRALSKDPKTRLGFLVAPKGKGTQSEGETLDLLLATHFPKSAVW